MSAAAQQPADEQLRRIIHLDLDAFFCAVEELRDPSLRGQPFAVGGRPDQRGVVASCSYAARAFGVRSALPMGRAVRLCPNLKIVPGHYALYSQASRQVMERLRAVTPLVEQISIDEAFLEVSALADPPEAIARRLQAEILTDLKLPCSLGVASNKLVAKIATDEGKSRVRRALQAQVESGAQPFVGAPNALTVVPPGEEAAFLAPLAVEALWGVGPKTAARLAELGIYTIGDLAARPPAELGRLFGKHGWELAQHARGQDERPLVTEHEVKSISQETTFVRDVRDLAVLKRTLQRLTEQVVERLQRNQLRGVTVKLKLRWADFTTLTRQTKLAQPSAELDRIYPAAQDLLEKTWSAGQAVRLIGVGVSDFEGESRQLALWESLPPDEPV